MDIKSHLICAAPQKSNIGVQHKQGVAFIVFIFPLMTFDSIYFMISVEGGAKYERKFSTDYN